VPPRRFTFRSPRFLQIRQLEESLGAQLFDRSGRHIQLTDAGEAWLGYAKNALRSLEEESGQFMMSRPWLTACRRLRLPRGLSVLMASFMRAINITLALQECRRKDGRAAQR
jgi:LysR family cyn operon transcriptional activator